jgi:heat shock protein HslJ
MEHEADPRLVGFTWLWEGRTGGAGGIVVVDPENHTLNFKDDGTFSVKMDCNSGGGSYATSSPGTIFMELGPATLVECGTDSLSNEMVNMFGPAQSYSFEDGDDLLIFNWVAGGPVDTFRKAGSEAEDSGFVGTTWQWEAFQDTAEINDITVPEPAKYTLTLNPDGTASIQADCNQVSWTYELEGSSLTFNTLGPSTLAFCGEESLDQQYLALLGETVTYVTDGGNLFLNLKLDSGNMVFNDGDGITTSDESNDGNVDESFFPDTIQMDVTGLAKTYEWQVVDASPIPPGPGGKGFPRHIVVGFDGEDPLATDYTQRRVMYVFPTEAYIDLYQANGSSVVADQVTRLEELIAGADDRQSSPQGFMPLLPPPGSLMERWVQFSDLNFEQGKGVRYISDSPFRQSIGVWTNNTTGYYYQGLTDDGRFYVSLKWPISTDLLPDTVNGASPQLLEAAGSSRESYEQYVQQVKSDLNARLPEGWSPDLSELDAMITSLSFQLE